MNFEDAMKRLDEILAGLSAGEVSLEQSLKLFAEGVKLVDRCNEELKAANLKIEELTAPKEESR